jgi:hypothetical protein
VQALRALARPAFFGMLGALLFSVSVNPSVHRGRLDSKIGRRASSVMEAKLNAKRMGRGLVGLGADH